MAIADTGGAGGGAGGQKGNAAAATTTALPASTYDNGTSGVGSSLTANANGALGPIDGVTVVACENILVKNQANGAHNGVYHIDSAGGASSKWKLTRVDWADAAGEFEAVVNVLQGGQRGQWWFGGMLGDDPDGTYTAPITTVGTDIVICKPWDDKARAGQRVFFAAAGTTGALAASTYSNGPEGDGRGATLIGDANGAIGDQDGVTLTAGDFLLVKNQGDEAENGLYIVDVLGDGSNPFELRRVHGVETSNDNDGLLVWLQGGSTLAGRMYQQTTNAPTMGTTALTFNIFSPLTSAAYTQTYSTADRTVANPTAADPGAVTAYSAHAPGATPVTSNEATDLDTTAAALATLRGEVAAQRTEIVALVADNLDLRQAITAIIDDLQAARLLG